jgi:hypothetical protein
MNGMTKARRRMTLGVFLFATSSLVSACLKSTEPQASLLQLNGSWNYTGVQTSPGREILTGTLTIARESGMSFQGSLVLQSVDERTGQPRTLNGVVSGTESGTDVIDFDANLESPPRRHVGRIVADTITGTWIGASPDGTTSSGTFRVERETK